MFTAIPRVTALELFRAFQESYILPKRISDEFRSRFEDLCSYDFKTCNDIDIDNHILRRLITPSYILDIEGHDNPTVIIPGLDRCEFFPEKAAYLFEHLLQELLRSVNTYSPSFLLEADLFIDREAYKVKMFAYASFVLNKV